MPALHRVLIREYRSNEPVTDTGVSCSVGVFPVLTVNRTKTKRRARIGPKS